MLLSSRMRKKWVEGSRRTRVILRDDNDRVENLRLKKEKGKIESRERIDEKILSYEGKLELNDGVLSSRKSNYNPNFFLLGFSSGLSNALCVNLNQPANFIILGSSKAM